MGWNEKCGYRPEIWRNTQNTEQIRIRVFLEDMAERTQIPPHPNHPRDEILIGLLCGVHRNGTTAHSTDVPIFVLDTLPCVTKSQAFFVRGAQIRKRGTVPPARGSPRCDVSFLLPAPPCVTKFLPLFCIACTSLRQPISLLLRPTSHTIPPAKIPAPNLDKLPNPDDTGANAAAAAPLFASLPKQPVGIHAVCTVLPLLFCANALRLPADDLRTIAESRRTSQILQNSMPQFV